MIGTTSLITHACKKHKFSVLNRQKYDQVKERGGNLTPHQSRNHRRSHEEEEEEG